MGMSRIGRVIACCSSTWHQSVSVYIEKTHRIHAFFFLYLWKSTAVSLTSISLPVSGKCRLPEHQWAIPSCNLQASGPDLSNPAAGLDDALRIRRMNSKIWVMSCPMSVHVRSCHMMSHVCLHDLHVTWCNLPKKSHLKCWLREAAIAQLLLVLPPGPCQWIPALRARVPLVLYSQFPSISCTCSTCSRSQQKQKKSAVQLSLSLLLALQCLFHVIKWVSRSEMVLWGLPPANKDQAKFKSCESSGRCWTHSAHSTQSTIWEASLLEI